VAALALVRLAYLGAELGKVPLGLIERVLSLEFGAECDLQQLGCGKAALLELLVEIIGKIHLDTRHTPNHTPKPTESPAHIDTHFGLRAPSGSGTSRAVK
jgi:hypothetical protein